MAYLMNYKGIAPSTAQYYNGIKKGYEDNGMDTKYLHDALVRSVKYHKEELCEP